MRISKCCKVEVENKYWCPKCNKPCKTVEQEESVPVVEAAPIPEPIMSILNLGAKVEAKEETVLHVPEKKVEPDPVPLSIGYILSYYLGCEGAIKVTSDRIHYSYGVGTVHPLTNYILTFIVDGLIEFIPSLRKLGVLRELEQRQLAAFKKIWYKEHYFLDEQDMEVYWRLSEKNFFRSMGYDMDGLIERGLATEYILKPFEIKPFSSLADFLIGQYEYENGYIDRLENDRQMENRADVDMIDNERHR